MEADPKLELQGDLRMVRHGLRTIRYVNDVYRRWMEWYILACIDKRTETIGVAM